MRVLDKYGEYVEEWDDVFGDKNKEVLFGWHLRNKYAESVGGLEYPVKGVVVCNFYQHREEFECNGVLCG